MDTYYCVKEPGECLGQCDICPVQEQLEFDFMKDRVADDVNHPDHYTMGGIEVFDFINSWQLSFAEGNVVKYVVRAPYKGSQLKDLKKARWYLDQLIKEAERDND
jgi:hypothetical protein